MLTMEEFLANLDHIRGMRLQAHNIGDDGSSDYRGTCMNCTAEQVFWGFEGYIDDVPITENVESYVKNPWGEFMGQVCLWSFGWRPKGDALLCPRCSHELRCECAAKRDMFPESERTVHRVR